MVHTSPLKGNQSNLYAEEAGKRLIWHVVSLYLEDGKLHRGRLRLFARRGTLGGEVRLGVEKAASKVVPFAHGLRESVKEGSVRTEATFPRLIANYLLGESGYGDNDLYSFSTGNAAMDPRDADAMTCQIEFYIGLKHMIDGNRTAAF